MRGRSPPGGWHFVVAPGVKLTAGTEEQLTKLIFEYRARNNLPLGEISRDIDRYYCSQWPDACHKDASDNGPSGDRAKVAEPLLNRVTRWAAFSIRRQPQGGHPLVSMEEANNRANGCVNCPRNVSWRGGCGGCSQSTIAILLQLRKARKTPKDGNLNACECGGWDNATAVHLPLGELELAPEQKAAMPASCWRKPL